MTPAKRSKVEGKYSKDEVAASFVACPRCSYFLSGYRLIHDDFETSVKESEAGWLSLTWDHETRLLVQKSFGSEVYLELDTFQAICPACQRSYWYQKMDPETDSSSFLVKILP